jgi:hypothetical protein
MATVLAAIINPAYRKIGVKSVSPAQQSDALAALNAMIGSWSVQGLIVPYKTRESFTLATGSLGGVRTIGSGGNFNTVRPLEITSAYIRDSNNNDYSLDVDMTLAEWNSLIDKTISTRPTRLCYLKEFALGKILFNYLPASAETIYIDSIKPLTAFALTSTTYSFSPEYEEAMIYNLSIRLAPEEDAVISPAVVSIAETSLANIKKQIWKPMQKVHFDAALMYNSGGGIDIYTDGA